MFPASHHLRRRRRRHRRRRIDKNFSVLLRMNLISFWPCRIIIIKAENAIFLWLHRRRRRPKRCINSFDRNDIVWATHTHILTVLFSILLYTKWKMVNVSLFVRALRFYLFFFVSCVWIDMYYTWLCITHLLCICVFCVTLKFWMINSIVMKINSPKCEQTGSYQIAQSYFSDLSIALM